MQNVTKNVFRCKGNDLIWTTYKSSFNTCKGKGYTKSFLACNSRATNAYQDRHYILYCCNLFFNPILVKYFSQMSIESDEENWALSMLIQFICRSAIRRNEDIHIYIPSIRMRTLLKNYLDK